MRNARVSSMIVAAALVLGGCAVNSADRSGDEGQTSALAGGLSRALFNAAGGDFSVTILRRAPQGLLPGDVGGAGRGEKIPGISFHYNVKSPRDVASGQATGKRAHGTIVLTKKAGLATPLLLEALRTNELLERVEFEFIQKTPAGEGRIRTVTLIGATVGALEPVTGDPEVEDVSFDFDVVEIDGVRWNVGEPADAGK
ncbi:MAG: type VI secretion system tube protein Hcp [Deltaproteobacteria bacterium]|nr:type VI secretion system tube protein Hcp [Deltaproteobacteria bacterium]